MNAAKGLIGDHAFLKAVSTGSFWSAMGRAEFIKEVNTAKELIEDAEFLRAEAMGGRVSARFRRSYVKKTTLQLGQ